MTISATFKLVVEVLGGLALFIFGIGRLSESLQRLTSNTLKKIINFLAKRSWAAVLMGLTITSIIQSSSATTVMTVGFVNAGLVTLRQAIGIIMGANIGTTVTAQIVSFKVESIAYPIIIIGTLMYFFGRKKRIKNTGMAILGLGLIFLGMIVMKNSLEPLKNSETFKYFLLYFSKNPFAGILVGVIITAILQSSSATIGLLIALASQGLIPLASAVPILMGDNIGTCATALIASIGTTITAKRTALAHLMFNIFGTIVFLILIYGFKIMPFIESITGSSVPHQIANIHTTFNIVTTIILFPFIGWYEKFIIKIFPGQDVVVNKNALYLDIRLIKTPVIALGQVEKEVIRVSKLAHEMFQLSHERLHENDANIEKKLLDREAAIDSITEDTVRYLTKTSQAYLTNALSIKLTNLLHIAYDLERAADHAESILYLIDVKEENRMLFTKPASLELEKTYERVELLFDTLINGMENTDNKKLEECEKIEAEVDAIVKETRTNHLIRLRKNECMPLSGVTFTDIILHLERIGDLLYGISRNFKNEV
ncbi:MAG: Na/Pi cotransporter family protein [Actinomycetia bacterium]|nr:Na/Pi cotransporter family protein [Actinomycetes bacterium]